MMTLGNSIIKTYEQNLEASDRVRLNLIPEFLQAGKGAEEAYFAFHREYFIDPVIGHFYTDFLLDEKDLEAYWSQIDSKGINRIAPQVGVLRTSNIKPIHEIDFPDAEQLPALANKFFEAVDKVHLESREEALKALMLVDICLRLMHLPFDGSGRCNEDLLVFLAQKWGIDQFTFSRSGFRGLFNEIISKGRESGRIKLSLDIKNIADGSCSLALNRALNSLSVGQFDSVEFWRNYYKLTEDLFKVAQEQEYTKIDIEVKKRVLEALGEDLSSHGKRFMAFRNASKIYDEYRLEN